MKKKTFRHLKHFGLLYCLVGDLEGPVRSIGWPRQALKSFMIPIPILSFLSFTALFFIKFAFYFHYYTVFFTHRSTFVITNKPSKLCQIKYFHLSCYFFIVVDIAGAGRIRYPLFICLRIEFMLS